jgi:hypothetical protein
MKCTLERDSSASESENPRGSMRWSEDSVAAHSRAMLPVF